jgi:hypothetical protein
VLRCARTSPPAARMTETARTGARNRRIDV